MGRPVLSSVCCRLLPHCASLPVGRRATGGSRRIRLGRAPYRTCAQEIANASAGRAISPGPNDLPPGSLSRSIQKARGSLMTPSVVSFRGPQAGRGRPRERAGVSRLDLRTSYGTAPSTGRRRGRPRSRAPPRWTPPRDETWTSLLPSRGEWRVRKTEGAKTAQGMGKQLSSLDPMHGGALPDEEHEIIVCRRTLGVRQDAFAGFGLRNKGNTQGKEACETNILATRHGSSFVKAFLFPARR